MCDSSSNSEKFMCVHVGDVIRVSGLMCKVISIVPAMGMAPPALGTRRLTVTERVSYQESKRESFTRGGDPARRQQDVD